ncbi:hypothetical protein OV079_09960 [Nannocystis pusilla]|uniref:Uncharacterized protein n=1 Tax=Nannocystis pusilla TaxID=889268 RepID=A0A9X3EKU2_9BACT|nr:hypothetical protein [Nannocystis pusilla]MCY1005887.1 hypothetical protein [Nannocystis pusilla]
MLGGERVGEVITGARDGADVAAEEDQDPRFVGLVDEETAEGQQEDQADGDRLPRLGDLLGPGDVDDRAGAVAGEGQPGEESDKTIDRKRAAAGSRSFGAPG